MSADIAGLPDPAVWAFASAAVLLGTILQRLAGQGFGMLAAPLVALVAPQMLPATLLFLGAVVGFSATAVDTSALDRRALLPAFVGRAAGAVLAALIAVRLHETGGIAIAVGLVVWLGVLLSLAGLRVAITPLSLVSAGTLAGIMGTLTAIGAPPMALLYQHQEARHAAAMQNAVFAFGMVVSVAALAWQGLVRAETLVFAASLLPGVALGLWLARPLAARVARRRIRPVALGLAATAATILLVRSF